MQIEFGAATVSQNELYSGFVVFKRNVCQAVTVMDAL
jgi:hypothetical protein